MTLVEHEPKQTIIENGVVYNYKRTFDDVSAYSTKREWDDYLCLSTGGSVGFGCHWVVDYYEDSNKKDTRNFVVISINMNPKLIENFGILAIKRNQFYF